MMTRQPSDEPSGADWRGIPPTIRLPGIWKLILSSPRPPLAQTDGADGMAPFLLVPFGLGTMTCGGAQSCAPAVWLPMGCRRKG
jgi:hypothetical protein